MRKPLKIYLFFLILITVFGVIGNILIQDEPNLEVTDIDTDIPGSETMVAIYNTLQQFVSEEQIIDIAVTPGDTGDQVELFIEANATDERTLQQQTSDIISAVNSSQQLADLLIEWQQQTPILTVTFTQHALQQWDGTATSLPTAASSYTYTAQ